MKYCPSCDLKFDDEVMRFCTKDGTPLIDEREPNFVEMPSEQVEEPSAVVASGADEPDEVTVVRRNIPVPDNIPPPPSDDDDFSDAGERPADRIVVPMSPGPSVDPLRNRSAAVYYQQPKQHTGLIVVLTILLTVTVLGAGAGLFWLLHWSFFAKPLTAAWKIRIKLNNWDCRYTHPFLSARCKKLKKAKLSEVAEAALTTPPPYSPAVTPPTWP